MTGNGKKLEWTLMEVRTFDSRQRKQKSGRRVVFQRRGNHNKAEVSNKTSRKMSITSVQTATESLSRHGSNVSLSCHSLCDSVDDDLQDSHPQYQDTILTIEELRAQLNSCFTCGVSWSEEHVSLDCRECGDYPLKRPCPLCEGRCHKVWKRDLTMSHASGKARWVGECGLSCGPTLEESLVPALEKLRATS
ncbi:protein pinocchio isoform X2 [Venturia canescens]|uniref:protein pinocchio isoform X2 n=1 Tax=Venturia canescens TaxID=32260 RepID=UPI001C9BC7DB|nr:protein pinocchio isoform X2 [Venturia canescens]